MEEQSQKKKTRRKIRSTQEFNQLNRSSLVPSSKRTKSEMKSVTKKNKSLSYLPKVDLKLEEFKENSSPNVFDNEEENQKPTKNQLKKSRSLEYQNLETTEVKPRRTRSIKNGVELSTEDEKRDSEVEFKKKRKRRRKKQLMSENDSSSGNEVNANTLKTPIKTNGLFHDNEYTENNSVYKNEIKRNSLKINKLRPHALNNSEDVCANIKNVDKKKVKSRKSSVSKNARLSFHSSYSLANTPTESEGLSDDVFTFHPNLNETLELNPTQNWKTTSQHGSEKKRNTFELKNSTFDISELPVVNDVRSANKSFNNYDADSKCIKFTSLQRKVKRSKSLCDVLNFSNRKSVTFMTPESKRVSKYVPEISARSSITLTLVNKSSTDSSKPSTRKSVVFDTSEAADRRSKSLCKGKISKIYPKSPHVSKRLSTTFNLSSKKGVTPQNNPRRSRSLDEQNDFHKFDSFSNKFRKSSNLNKLISNSSVVSEKKSVSFFTPENNKKVTKASFKKSPYVRRSTLNLSEISSETSPSFDIISETGTSKKSSVMPSPIPQVLKLKNGFLSPKKSVINLITPSPYKSDQDTKSMTSSSYFLRNSVSIKDVDVDKTEGSSEDSKSDAELKITKRKRWNRSLGVSILDNSGVLHNISPPWEEAMFGEPQNLDRGSEDPKKFSSFNKNENSTKKSLPIGSSATKNPTFSKKIPANLTSCSSPVYGPKVSVAEALGQTFSPVKNVDSPKKSLRFQDEPGTSKQETKPTLKRTKLPNFALIHQRAYDKLENVKEMSERKVRRAQQLLSGKKPGAETCMKVPTPNLKVKSPTLKIKSPRSRKLLRYSPRHRTSLEKMKKSEPSTSNVIISKKQTKVIPSTSNPQRIVKPVERKIVKSHIPKPVNAEKKPLSKLGFKVAPEGKNKISKQEEVKAVANKTRVKRDSLEDRRNVIQNVRTNRRFELLMKMRNKK